jgi:two-component system, OmpR family, sensor histidine kinase VicK
MTSAPYYYEDKKSLEVEVTRVFYGVESVVNVVLQFLTQANNKIDACIDQTRPSLIIDIDILKQAFVVVKKRGIKLRYITEITKDNLSYCKQLLTMVDELRHLDGIKGNLYLSESEYLAPATFHEKGKPASQIIYSNVKEIVEHQKYVFDTLWAGAVPAEQKIEQIEEGTEDHEYLQVIKNQNKASRIFTELVKSIKKEALIFLPSDKVMVRIDKLGIVNHLIRASLEKKVTIKIICPLSEDNKEILNRINKEDPSIQVLNGEGNSLFGMCIVDNEKLLRTEIRELNTDDFSKTIDFAIYSNRKLTVNSFKSIFDLLWNERILNDQLKVNDKTQKEFINIAAHELRTPAQAILGYAELAMMKVNNENAFDSEKRVSFMAAVYRNASRLQRLTNDILDVTRIESGSLRLNLEKFDLNQVISDIVDDYRSEIERSDSDVKLVHEVQNKAILVEGDKNRLTQVISNLVGNAIKFTSQGNITVKSEIENEQNNKVRVSVKDTGSGIDSKIMPRLFTKFVAKSNAGTGLGLFISKSIIEAHGGKIWALNNPSLYGNGSGIGGATFTFNISLSQEPK